jgi:hypothetical protein
MNNTTIDESVQQLADYFVDIINDDNGDKPGRLGKLFEDYKNYLKAEVSDPLRGPREEPDDEKLSAQLDEIITEMIVAAPSLHPQRARRWLLQTPHGRELLAQHTTKKEAPMNRSEEMQEMHKFVKEGGMSAIAKRILETGGTSLTEHEYTTLVQEAASLNKVSFEKAFADPTTQQAYKIVVREAGYVKSLGYSPDNIQKRQGVGTATLTPTSVGVDDINDPMEAVRLLSEMATKQGRKFEDVFADPNNKWLAGKTYTGAQRPTASSTSGSELQR